MTIGTCVCRRSLTSRTALALGLAFTLVSSHKALGQDATITNLYELTQAAFSESFYIPFSLPCEWRAYSLNGGEPWWVDCSALPCSDLISASTNYTSHGVDIVPVWLTKNVQSGETLMQSDWATDVVARVTAPSGYQPGQLSYQDGTVWRMWLQATNCPDCWGIDGAFPPPTITLRTFLADVSDHATYESNLEVEAEAQAAAASSFTTGGRFTAMNDEGGGMMMDDSSDPCAVTNGIFAVLSVSRTTNGWTTLIVGPTCTNYIVGWFSANTLSSSVTWVSRSGGWAGNGTTSWTDTTTTNVSQRFYRAIRILPTQTSDWDGDGMPDIWEASHGLNPFDPGDATNDLDGDGYSNFDEFLMGTDPTNPKDPITVYVDIANTNGVYDGTQAHPFQNIQDAIESSVPVSSNLAIRVRPGTYCETVSNLQYDPSSGSLLSSRQFLYIYAANTNWSLSTDPESHIIDALDLPNMELVDLSSTAAPVVEFNGVTRARINGFTIRGGQGPYGGGVLAYSTNGPVYISNCIIVKNGSASSEAGGIYIQAATNSLIYNTAIVNNTGTIGAIFDVNGSHIWNCTIVSNGNLSATLGAVTGDFGPPNVRNSIIWGNGTDLYFANADYSTFGSNLFVTAGAHNLSVDPQLVNTAFGNYRLQTNSPVFGAGSSLPIEQRDLYGNSRPTGGRFDIGANEYTDSLGDGIQDDWKIKHGLSLTVSQASLDPDGDGLNNLQEYNNNTDPHNPDTDGDGISDGPVAPPGSGLQPGPDPNPTTPDVIWNTVFWDYYFASRYETYIDGVPSPQWINEPITRPRAVVLSNKHIGDHVNLQWQYLGGPGSQPFLAFYVPQATQASIIPDLNAVPLNQIQVGPGGFAPPSGPWGSTIAKTTFTNSDVCAGFDDETVFVMQPYFIKPYLSVPQKGTNTVSVVINPTNLANQVIFQSDNTNVATVTPAQATGSPQLISVAGHGTTLDITNAVVSVLGYGAQNSYTTICSQVSIDVLPMRTNVTVAPHLIIASTMTGNPPTGMPSTSVLKSYLDSVYGIQASVFMTVLPGTTNTVNYDLDRNGALSIDVSVGTLTAEESAITSAVSTPGAINVYYVNVLTNVAASGPNAGKAYVGITYPGTKTTFIQDLHQQSSQNLTAHEIGYSLGLSTVGPGFPYLRGHIDRLMWYEEDASDPCRLIHTEWYQVNEGLKP